ncbi:hypothetical protein ACMFMG_002043 [Clarireedia jacksonii]
MPNLDYEVKGKVAIVTGGGSGISLALAALLLSKGCNVVIADLALLPSASQLLIAYIDTDPNQPTCLYHATDVTDWSALSSLFTYTLSHFHQIDILVPGAGVFDPPSSNFYNPPGTPYSSDTIEKSTYRTLDVNITHPIRLTQMGVEYWVKEKRPGRVVCLSSIGGQIGVMETPLYHASKFAITGFVRSMKNLQELGIRVVGVAPGLVNTPLWYSQPDKMQMLTSNQKWITPETTAEAILDLLTMEQFIGGTILEVSGSGLRVVKELGDEGPTWDEGYMIGNLGGYKEEIYKGLREGKMGDSGKHDPLSVSTSDGLSESH